mgnify:CR=1 FL=1
MRKRLTARGTIAVILLLSMTSRGSEQLTARMQSKPMDDRIAAPRLDMPAIADTPEIALQKVRHRKTGGVDAHAQRRLRATLRKQKTRRVVAAQN